MRPLVLLLAVLSASTTAYWVEELQIEPPPAAVDANLLDADADADADDWDDAAVDRKIALGGGVSEQQEDELPGEPLTPDDFSNSRRQVWLAAAQDAIETAGLFEGDIRGVRMSTDNGRNAIRNLALRWRGAVVPYIISPRFDEHARAVIAGAMDDFHSRSCVRFVPRTRQRDFVRIVPDPGCSSHVGRVGHGQVVSLGEGCIYKGVVQHELMHVLGFWHEQSRVDRDSHVAVLWRNIVPGMEFNFKKVNARIQQTLGVAYDADSVTHYGRFAFSRGPGLPTLVARQQGQEFLGQQHGLSKADVTKLNKLYECRKVPAPAPPIAQPGECADSNARCQLWAADNECARAPDFMAAYCAHSCQVCHYTGLPTAPEGCADDNAHCAAWAAHGQCTINPVYMLRVCRRACAVCRP